MLEINSLVQLGIWAALILYFIAFIPQITLNYRLKSAAGLSDFCIWTFFNGYIAQILYVFFLDLPLAYKVFVPLGGVCIAILVFQRFYYVPRTLFIRRLALVYAVNIALVLIMTPWMINNPVLAGNITGWIATIAFAIYQVPQMIKIYTSRSIEGFSFTFATICGIASMLELAVAIIVPFPLQTQMNGLRGIICYIIFFLQFILYRA